MRFEQGGSQDGDPCRQLPEQQPVPPGLAELTERLRREADRLAARYPAAAPAAGIVATRPAAAPVVKLTAMLAVVAAILLAAAVLPLLRVDPVARQRPPDRAIGAAGGQLRVKDSLVVQPSSPAAIAPAATFPPPLPVLKELPPPSFLMRVSGPELEAMLDLWEADPAEPTRLSI